MLMAEFEEFQTRFRALSVAADDGRLHDLIRRMRFPVTVPCTDLTRSFHRS